MIAAALMMLQVIGGVPGFAAAEPSPGEQVALPHLADAMRPKVDAAARLHSLDAALALLPQPTRFRGAVQCMRGAMLLDQDQVANRAAGLAAFDECYRLDPDEPLAQRAASQAAFMRDDPRTGARLLTRAIAAQPQLTRGFEPEHIESILRALDYVGAGTERRALVIALAGTNVARNDAATYSGWVRESVLAHVEKGEVDAGAALLPYVVDPEDGLAMLVDRRYAPLWPRIETWAGGDLSVQREALLRAAQAAYDLDPTLGHAKDTAWVLARMGHADDGVAMLDRAIAGFGPPRDDFDYAMGVVRLARLRARAGERDMGRILAPMTAALADGAPGALVNVVPNLAIYQIALGRPQDALATLDRHLSGPDKVEAPAAYGYFVAIRGCALSRLGREPEARAAIAQVRQRYANNRAAMSIATQCMGSDAEVLADWMARVDDPERRKGALMEMIAVRTGVMGDRLSLTEPALRRIADRPEVARRLQRHARPLPASYLPALQRMAGE